MPLWAAGPSIILIPFFTIYPTLAALRASLRGCDFLSVAFRSEAVNLL